MDAFEHAIDNAPTSESTVSEIVELVSGSIRQRVLVVGSLPPGGRDLALIVRPCEERALAESLTAAGLARRGLQWASFFDCSAYLVELIPTRRLSLPAGELDALYAEAGPIGWDGELDFIVRPTPHHLLLLLARRLVREGRLHPKRRARIDNALIEDPDAWTKADSRASLWGLDRALALLERTHRTNDPVPLSDRLLALFELVASTRGSSEKVDLLRRPLAAGIPRRNLVIAISGLDGAGKSFQARALQNTLELLVCPTVVEWTPLGQNRAIEIARSAKKLVQRFDHDTPPAEPVLALSYADLPANPARRLRERSALITQLWTLFVVLVNAGFHRRPTLRYPFAGKVVIFDRYVCDSSAWLSFWYGAERRFSVQKGVLRALSPQPLRSFFLNVRPEVALIRKGEMSLAELRRMVDLYWEESNRLGVRVMDGEEPPTEIAAEIARQVWTALPRGDRG
jgi:thymidylate kinase